MLSYAAFSLLAYFTLQGKLRYAVWIFMAALAVKTWLAQARERNQ